MVIEHTSKSLTARNEEEEKKNLVGDECTRKGRDYSWCGQRFDKPEQKRVPEAPYQAMAAGALSEANCEFRRTADKKFFAQYNHWILLLHTVVLWPIRQATARHTVRECDGQWSLLLSRSHSLYITVLLAMMALPWWRDHLERWCTAGLFIPHTHFDSADAHSEKSLQVYS